ncbi:CAAX prenyl protease 1 homolog isoform X2 [Arctopsyche grandis]|uniref:CAAX prenyl protease 1 homolog isoform X2 n=1 Tax=Arctopsyche grandis TaxID=121162 RepID=UPI00406D9FEC
MVSTETVIVVSIILFSWAEYCWELFLSLRQIRVYKTKKKIPHELESVLDLETFEKARVYGLDKAHFNEVKSFFSIVTNTCLICFGWMSGFWSLSENLAVSLGVSRDNEIAISCFYIIVLNILSLVVDMPFSIYHTFVLEERHGFNKQTVGFFIKDNIKNFILVQVLAIPITSVIVYIVQRGGDMFIVWLWSFCCVMILLLVMIYPSLIAPLFDKYSPLPDGPLRSSIEALAASLKFPLGQLYVVEGSKRSAHSNAYFYGLFGSKRIVLFDTLLENYVKKETDEKKTKETDEKKDATRKKKGCNDAEVLAVLAHELGHWSYSHIYINLVVTQVNLLLTFMAFGLMFKYAPLYTALGFAPGVQPILVGLVTVLQMILAPYNALLSFAMTILSRKLEFQADNFAIKLGHSKFLKNALIKLNSDNLGFPVHDPLYSAWHHSHPTLLQRMENLNKKE